MEEFLTQLGLNQKQAKVYLACLELGEEVVSQIAKKAGLNRITTYEILKGLDIKGFVRFSKEKNKIHFSPVSPKQLINRFKNSLQQLEGHQLELEAVFNANKKKPKVTYYEGINGIKQIYEDTLTVKKKPIITVTNPEPIEKKLGMKFWRDYWRQRIDFKINVKGFCPDNKRGKQVKKEQQKYLRQAKLFPKEKYNVETEIQIYDNKVALISFMDEMGLIIENKEIADSLRSLWQLAWDK